MKWFKNKGIGAQLGLGFLMVAIIAVAVGGVGYSGLRKLEVHINDIANVHLTGMNALLTISEAQTAVRAGQRNLANAAIGPDQRKGEYQYITDAIARYETYLLVYTALEKDPREQAEWQTFVPLWDDWVNKMQASLEVARAYDSAVVDQTGQEVDLLQALSLANAASAAAFLPAEASLIKLTAIKSDLAEQARQMADEDVRQNAIVMISVTVGGFLLALVIGQLIARGIKKPIQDMVAASNKMASGDLDIDLNVTRKDEMGQLAEAFMRMSHHMNEVLTQINTASEQVATGSRQVSDSSMALSQGATEQASAIEELTASIEEIASQTKLNADNANQASGLAKEAKTSAVEGDVHMQDMLRAMDEINEASNNISRIIKVIDAIAFQTNILALNAAVEAARAGQHGKGFAVVADEVRNLAARSANAAKETTLMIEGSIEKVAGGTKIAKETAKALTQIVTHIDRVSTLAHDIAVASKEQSIGVDQINQGIAQIADVIQTTSASSQETAAASDQLSSQAVLLKDQVSQFNLRKHKGIKDKNPLEGLNPAVLKALDDMHLAPPKEAPQGLQTRQASKKIVLSESEFGKY